MDRLIQLVVGIILGLFPIIGFFLWKKFPPKSINSIYGYRTNLSMKNEATWKTANDYAPQLFVPVGVLTILIAIVGFLLLDEFYLIVVIFFVISLISIIPLTEWYLHKHFDKDGNPKKQNTGGKET